MYLPQVLYDLTVKKSREKIKKYGKSIDNGLTVMYNIERKNGITVQEGGKSVKFSLKALRINKGYNQEEASKLIGVSVETLANYEKGLTYPDIPILKKIEEVYETKYDDINFF